MKALIVSDNHGNLDSLEELIDLYEDEVDLWLHCGDSEFMAGHSIWEKFKTVRGNMDIDSELPLNRVEEFDDEKLLVVHGHNQRVGFTLDLVEDLAQEKGADIVFYGHTHIAQLNQTDDDVYLINPGSIVQPRGTLRIGSYAIYEKNKENRIIRFYDWNHNELADLSKKLD